jgi:Restriction endonuclease
VTTSNKSKILEWFYRAKPRNGLIDFGDLMSDAAAGALSITGIDNAAFVASNSVRIWNALRSEQEIRKAQGVNPIFEMIDSVSKCRWQATGRKSTSAGELRRQLRLMSRPAIIGEIDTLDWRQFEALGCTIVQLCGANQFHLTPPGNECGIDFFATITVNGNSHIFSGATSPIRIIGQSKKYESRVDEDRIKVFNETICDLQKRAPKITKLVPAWFQAARGPIVGWMVAHKGFKSGARTRAHSHGILLSDTIDLAEIAALSRELAETASPDDRAKELVEKVKQLIK